MLMLAETAIVTTAVSADRQTTNGLFLSFIELNKYDVEVEFV